MHLLPVLLPVLLLVQEPVLLVQAPVLELPVLLLVQEPVLLPEPRRNAALARMHRFFQVLLRTVFH